MRDDEAMDAIAPASAPSPPPVARARAGGGFQVAMASATAGGGRAGLSLSGTGRAWEAAPNPEFRARIARAERSAEHARDGYGQRNAVSGAMGRYQFLSSTLRDLGWQGADGGWTEVAARQGVRSEAEFLGNPAAQEAAMTAFLRRTEQQIERNGALARSGGSIRGLDGGELRLSEAGLVAAAHRRGAGTLARYLAHRTETPEAALSSRERRAFQVVERRLQEFEGVPYASLRRPAASPALVALRLGAS